MEAQAQKVSPGNAAEVTSRAVATARELAERFREGAAERDAKAAFPHEQLDEIRASGLEGLLVPREYGGDGGEYTDHVRVVGILAEGDPNVAQIYHVHGIGVELVTEAELSPEMKRELHERSASGALRWTNAYSELGGKHIFDYRVKIAPDGADYVLNGEKFYCTGSLGGDEMYVTAVVDGTEDVRILFVPCGAPGVTIDDDWAGMGQVATASGTTRFEDVRIAADRVVAIDRMNYPESVFGPLGQLSFSAIYLGIAKDAMRDAIEYASTKARAWVHSGVDRATEDPYTLMRIGEMEMWLHAAETLQERALDLMDAARREPSPEARALASVATSEAKAFTTIAGLKVCEMLFQVSGSSATLRKYGYDRHWRNVRTLSLHDPADYKLRMVGDYYLNGTLPPITSYT